MTRIEIKNALNDPNHSVLSGNAREAFGEYYNEDVSLQENHS